MDLWLLKMLNIFKLALMSRTIKKDTVYVGEGMGR